MRRSALWVSRTILDCFPCLRLRQVDCQVAMMRRPKWSEQSKISGNNYTPEIYILTAGGWQTFGGVGES